jgi:amino acid adenylation domain-containing protein/non-ribosomal peptide synthase protein (TIGR01720 family)
MDGFGQTYSLSFPQEQIWFHEAFLPGIPLYNIGGSLLIEGPLDPIRFREALRATIAQADALRIVLHPTDAVPVQEFRDFAEFSLETYEFPDDAKARDWMVDQFNVPFALYDSPLFHFALIRISAVRHYWFYKYHHLINDGWGISLVVQRVAAHYAALSDRRADTENEHRTYRDFITAERSYSNSARYREDQQYWSEKLRLLPESLARKRDHASPSKNLSVTIERELLDAVGAQFRAYDASVFHVFVAAICAYFARTAGCDEILLGLPALNRRSQSEKNTVGLYAGLKPALFRFDPRMAASDLVQKIRLELTRDYRHYRFPLAKMGHVGALHDGLPTGLFDVVLSFEIHDYDAVFHGSPVHMEALLNRYEQNGLVIFVRDYHSKEDPQIYFSYNTGAFGEADIRAASDGILTFVREIQAAPGSPLGRLSMVPRNDRSRLQSWSAGPSRSVGERCVHEAISSQARANGDRTAVLWGSTAISHRELECSANGLAWRLRSLGVVVECCVGIALGRSPSLLIAVLAVLKAGAAYVPIDSTNPRERIRSILEDAGVRLVIAEPGELEWLAAGKVRVECVDPRESAESAPPSDSDPDSLAYVIYTSGSTGRPKGVMVSHRSIVNYVAFSVERYGLQNTAGVVPLHSSMGFDATATSLLAPLIGGSCVELLSGASGLAAVSEAMRGGRDFQLLKLTPSHLPALEDELGSGGDWSRPELLVLGGEALHDTSLKFWREAAPHTRVINEYGPTEAAVGCCVFEAAGEPRAGVTPIGFPIWNTRLYVLDCEMEPVPIGAIGELYIGGMGLARGYVSRPGLTAECFVPDPFAGTAGQRLYRTGDLARYLEDGSLEFRGRRDEQVKLRGHRIELGEIEEVMRSHPAVRDIVVQLENEGPFSRLIAYVIAADGPAPTPEQLRRHARQQLPETMIPSAWIELDRFPLTTNGKLDRKHLPRVQEQRRRDDAPAREARSALERELLAIWSQILGVSEVGPEDNFFDLGGDSILALRIASKARVAGIKVGLPDIFRCQTVAALAAAAQRQSHEAPAEEEGAALDAPLTPIQQWLFEQQLADSNRYNQIVELEIAPAIEPRILEECIEAIIARHDSLRTRIVRLENEWMQRIAPVETFRLHVERLPRGFAAPEEEAFVAEKISALQDGIDLEHGPVIQALLLEPDGPGARRLFLTAHHVAIDVVSWRMVLDNLDSLLRRTAPEDPIRIPPPSTTFRSWVRHLTGHAALPAVAAEMEYWDAVAGAETEVLARDIAGVHDNTVASTEIVTRVLDRSATALLTSVSSAQSYSVNEILLAALARSVSIATGRHSLLVDLEGHGRDTPFEALDLSSTTGWFTTIYPLVLAIQPDAADAEVLSEIQRQFSAVPNGGYGYGLLRYLSADCEVRDRLAALPRPELLFNYLGRFDQALDEYGDWFRGIRSFSLSRCRAARRPYALELDISILRNELTMQWTYSRNLHSRRAVEDLADTCIQCAAAFARCSPQKNARMYTPADFPAAKLDQQDLDRFLRRFQ